MNGTIGEIRGFGGNFAPRTWAFCQGQLLAIAQNTALFSILGTTYGGDGRTTFALPDLRGRIPISEGRGPGLMTQKLGARSGIETVNLNILQIPSHFHFATTTVTGGSASGTVKASTAGSTNDPTDAYPGQPSNIGPTQITAYDSSHNTTLAADALTINLSGIAASTTILPTGGSQSHYNMMPYLTINWIICMIGVFPSRS